MQLSNNEMPQQTGTDTLQRPVILKERIEQSAALYPENVAVHTKERAYTYQELNQAANKVAHYLLEKGVKQNDIVAISLERSFEMMATIFGVIKAGAAYLPVSPYDPFKRVNALLSDAEPKAVLIMEKMQEKWQGAGIQASSIEDILAVNEDFENPDVPLTEDDLVYVIYTSGSTGMPKGVMISNKALINRLDWMQLAYPIDQEDVILQKTPFTFDVSVWELFWWALEGASVNMLSPEAEKNPLEIISAIVEKRVTVIHFVPSMFNMFLQYFQMVKDSYELSHLKWVFNSGEALKASHVNLFNSLFTSTSLVNLYGPTEAAIDATHYLCGREEYTGNIPIGKPIMNMGVTLLNDLDPVEDGEAGELCLSGVGLAKGYLKREELTAEKFIDNPLKPGERLYRTGDLARINESGLVEYLGRIDHQVKIRGIRIELGEIEATLSGHEKVHNAAVILQQPSENVSRLIAYYTAGEELPSESLKSHLEQHLPVYMIPNLFVRLEELPLTKHGKVDRKDLQERKAS